MNLYFLNYNNYYNRIVKKEDTLEGYLQYLVGEPVQHVINWNPGDGVDTQQILNSWNYPTPDYMLAVTEDGEIDSRWFVIDADYQRNSQYRLRLHRDVIVDNYDAVLNSTAFIEKGYLSNNNPLIFNNENMGFNQIKQSETLLSNNLKTPWIVLYLSRYHTNDQGNYVYNQFTGEFIDEADKNTADYELNSLEDYKYYAYSKPAVDAGTGKQYKYAPNDDITFHSYVQKLEPDSTTRYIYSHNDIKNNGVYTAYAGNSSSTTYPIWTGSGWAPVSTMTLEQSTAAWTRLMESYKQGDTLDSHGLPINSYSKLGTQAGATTLTQESGKTIKVGNKVYRIVVNTESEYEFDRRINVTSSSALGRQIVKECFENFGINTSGRTLNVGIELGFYPYYTTIEFQETQLASNGIKYDIKYEGAVTTDSVYEIIATPYRDVTFTSDGAPFQHSGRIALQWFQDIINRYNGAGRAYDIQLVPYVPQQFDVTNITNLDKIYCYTGSDASNRINYAVGFRLPSASFTLDYNLTLPSVNINNKISNETQLYRLVSPNGVGEYEFSPSKNGGFTGFEVDCTLIPFNPYIKVNPRFGWLYGTDFNDFRGLILGGDFSLPILNNNWSTYQLNNKYYQQIFDRKIESQEYNNKWALASDIVGSVAGAAGGVAAGAAAGSIVPGIGTAIGAVAGGLASSAGGVMDIIGNQKLRREQIGLQKDLFGMELGTIKARADSLTRGAIYNINNKYFPYIEYYTCTDKEREALMNKIKYNGMTIGVIGKIEDYIDYSADWTYIQARVIDIDIEDDTHMANTINGELQGGVRIA